MSRCESNYRCAECLAAGCCGQQCLILSFLASPSHLFSSRHPLPNFLEMLVRVDQHEFIFLFSARHDVILAKAMARAPPTMSKPAFGNDRFIARPSGCYPAANRDWNVRKLAGTHHQNLPSRFHARCEMG